MLGGHLASREPHRRSILIVEDDMLLAMAIGLCLEEAGYDVAGQARSVEAALSMLAREKVDAALLDVNLAGELVYPVANALAQRGVPFVFVTAYKSSQIPENHRSRPLVRKPYYDAALCDALANILTEAAAQATS